MGDFVILVVAEAETHLNETAVVDGVKDFGACDLDGADHLDVDLIAAAGLPEDDIVEITVVRFYGLPCCVVVVKQAGAHRHLVNAVGKVERGEVDRRLEELYVGAVALPDVELPVAHIGIDLFRTAVALHLEFSTEFHLHVLDVVVHPHCRSRSEEVEMKYIPFHVAGK